MATWAELSGGGDSGGGSTPSGGGTWASLAAPAESKYKPKKSSFFGLHLPKLGLGELVHMPGDVVSGLTALGAGLAPGGRPAGEIPSMFAKGAAAATLGTFGRIGDAGLNALTLGHSDWLGKNDVGASIGGWLGSSPEQEEQLAGLARGQFNKGLLPGLINDIGSIAIAGQAAGGVARLGTVGKLAAAEQATAAAAKAGIPAELVAARTAQFADASTAARAASRVPLVNRLVPGAKDLAGGLTKSTAAGRAGAAAEGLTADASQVARRAATLEKLHGLGHPYQTAFGEVIRPLTKAGQATILARADVPGVADDLDGVEELTTVPEPVSPFGIREGGAGPAERKLFSEAAESVPEFAQRTVERLPEAAQRFLAKQENRIIKHRTGAINREGLRVLEDYRNRVLHGPAMTKTALAGQLLVDGGLATVDEANRLVFDHVQRRLDGQALVDEAVRDGVAPEVLEQIESKLGRTLADPITPEMYAANPELRQILDESTELWKQGEAERTEILRSGRLGNRGLEAKGTDKAIETTAQRRAAAALRRAEAGLAPKRRMAEREAASQADKILKSKTRLARYADLIDKGQAKILAEEARVADLAQPEGLAGKSLSQRSANLPVREGETVKGSLRRGDQAGKAATRAEWMAEKQRGRIERQAKMTKMTADMEQALVDQTLPRARLLDKAVGLNRARATRLEEALDNPSLRATPAEWQPMMHEVRELAKLGKDDPLIAEALSSLPKSLSEVIAFAKTQHGFEPTHISDLTPQDVARIVHSPQLILSKGREAVAGTRNARNFAGYRTRTIEALAAAQINVVWEREANHFIDLIEKGVARPFVPTPGWSAWDPERGFLLSTDKYGNPGQHITRGAEPTLMVPDSVVQAIKAQSKDYTHPVFATIGHNKAINKWKELILSWRPGQYTNDLVGSTVLATLQGATPADFIRAYATLRTGKIHDLASAERYLLGAKLPPDVNVADFRGIGANSVYAESTGQAAPSMFIHEAGPRGLSEHVSEGTKHPVEAVKGVFRATTNPRTGQRMRGYSRATARVNAFNATIHRLSRGAVYLAKRRQGMTDLDALMEMRDTLVDYGNLTPVERAIATTVFPFYSFQKSMLKLMVKFPAEHPVRAALAIQLAQLNEDLLNPDMPGIYTGLAQLPGTNKRISTTAFNPFQDGLGLITPEGLGNAMNPALKAVFMNALAGADPYNEERRVDMFGNAVTDSSPASEFAEQIIRGPQGMLLSSTAGIGEPTGKGALGGLGAFFGVRTYTPAQIEKLKERLRRGQMRASGQMHQGWTPNKGVKRADLDAQYGVESNR